MSKNYSPEYKVEFCKRIVEGGEKVAAVCRDTGVLENTAYGWVSRYYGEQGTAVYDKSVTIILIEVIEYAG